MTSKRLLPFLIMLLLLPALACDALLGGDDSATPTAEAVSTIPVPPTSEDAAEPTPAPTDTPQATATSDATANFVSYTSATTGITLEHPADWEVVDSLFLAVASDQSILLEESTDLDEGGVLVIIAGPTEDFPTGSAEEILTESLADMDMENATILEGPTATEIQGQEAAVARISAAADDGTPLSGISAVIHGDGRTALVAGITPQATEDQYYPILEAMVYTVQIGEPTEDPFGDLFDTPEPGDATEEPGGAEGTATPPAGELPTLTIGDTVGGTLSEGARHDYPFQATVSTPLAVVLNPVGDAADNLDLVIEIYAAGDTDTPLAEVDEALSGEPEVLEFTPDADGEYVIRVRDFFSEAGDYEIGLYDLAEALTVETTVADDAENTIRVCAPAGAPFIAIVRPASDFDPVLELSGAGGGLLAGPYDAGASGDNEVAVYSGGTSSAEDYPVIITVSGFAGSGGDYTLLLLPAGVIQDGC